MQQGELRSRFQELFGDGGEIRLFFAPARVDLIGEHMDYIGGHVLSCALTVGSFAAVRLRTDRIVRLASLKNGGRIFETTLDEELPVHEEHGWLNIPKGMVRTFRSGEYLIPTGADVLYAGDVPPVAGLGASTSLAVVTGFMVRELFGWYSLSNQDLARFCQNVENDPAGTRHSIADPFASIMGRRDCGIFLKTSSFRYEYMPLHLGNHKLVITDSGVRNKEVDALRVQRREECEKALKKLRTVTNIGCLGDLNTDRFESCKDVIMNDTNIKRVRHVVYENARTVRAVSALRVNNLKRVGVLMNESHASLRDNFEVTTPEVDFLAETARGIPGVLGSRMTGAGFEGSTISIVAEDALESFREEVQAAYKEKFGLEAKVCVAEAGDGAREIGF